MVTRTGSTPLNRDFARAYGEWVLAGHTAERYLRRDGMQAQSFLTAHALANRLWTRLEQLREPAGGDRTQEPAKSPVAA